MVRDLATNLYAGARLCFMLPVARGAFRTTQDQAFALLVLGSATILAIEFASAGESWFPSADRVGFYALAVVAGLIGCFAAVRLLGVAERLSTVVIMLLAGAFWLIPSVGPVFLIAGTETLAPNKPAGAILGIVIVLWLLGIALRAIHLITGGGIVRPAAAASIIIVFTALPKLVLTPPAVWLPAPAKLPSGWTQENLYYGQFGMMERVSDWLANNRPGVAEFYFVGFGADASEPVFVNEMRTAAQVFEQNFDARERSLVLINSRATVRQAPLANLHNLGRTLAEVAKRMDPKEDVLVLYLSTPALAKSALRPRFEPLDFVAIHAADIRRMLDDAGIVNRVIVLSACSADGFVAPLRGPNTVVIAATANGRHTRGCKGDGPSTPFGSAFFGNALWRSFSLPEAFEIARAALADSESAANRAAAEPVIDIGDQIAVKLAEIAGRLQTSRAANLKTPSITAPPIGTRTRRKP